MMTKNIELKNLLNEFANYVSEEDLLKAKILSKISTAIAKKRVDMGMRQNEFAKYIGVSQSMISKWESENYNFTIESLVDVFSILKMDFDVVIKENEIIYDYKKMYKSSKHKFEHNSSWKSGCLKKLDKAV